MRERLQSVLAGGLYAGLIGYGTVVLLVSAFDVLGGHSPFYTASLFGTALFYTGADAGTSIAAAPVLAYNALHLVLFLIAGTITSWFVVIGERHPAAQYFLFASLVFAALGAMSAMIILATPLMGFSAWWKLGIPSVIAVGAMIAFLVRTHPLLRQELKELPWGDASPDGLI